ncbi:MAG: hypothetical protein ACJ742_14290 [Actinomycetes bacterium]|jgi:hypothetical protein
MNRVVRRHRTIPCEQGDPEVARSTYIKVEAQLAGGRRVSFDPTDPTGDTFRAGQRVKLAEAQQPAGQATYSNILDLERIRPMLVLVALFVLAVVGFGGLQGSGCWSRWWCPSPSSSASSCRPSCAVTAPIWGRRCPCWCCSPGGAGFGEVATARAGGGGGGADPAGRSG